MITGVKFTSSETVQFMRNGVLKDVKCPDAGLTEVCSTNCIKCPEPDSENGTTYITFMCANAGPSIAIPDESFIDDRVTE